jgi:hypothetical protein
MLVAMTLPTDPDSIAELERLIAECEHKRQAWLEATERLSAWLQRVRHGDPFAVVGSDRQTIHAADSPDGPGAAHASARAERRQRGSVDA